MAEATLLPMVAHVGQSIQLALAPAFLLTAVCSFLGVLAGRLGRVVDRARTLTAQVWTTRGMEHDAIVEELRQQDRRIAVLNGAILLAVGCAGTLCLVISLLFTTTIIRLPFDLVVAILFIAAMGMLMLAFVLFIHEVGLGGRVIRVRRDALTHEAASDG